MSFGNLKRIEERGFKPLNEKEKEYCMQRAVQGYKTEKFLKGANGGVHATTKTAVYDMAVKLPIHMGDTIWDIGSGTCALAGCLSAAKGSLVLCTELGNFISLLFYD